MTRCLTRPRESRVGNAEHRRHGRHVEVDEGVMSQRQFLGPTFNLLDSPSVSGAQSA